MTDEQDLITGPDGTKFVPIKGNILVIDRLSENELQIVILNNDNPVFAFQPITLEVGNHIELKNFSISMLGQVASQH